MAYVYRHIRLDTGYPFYIGIGSDEKNYSRAHAKKGRGRFWDAVVSKHGYYVEIMMDGLTRPEAIVKEKEFIRLYGRLDAKTGFLINMTDGGDGFWGKIMTPEYSARLSAAGKKRGMPEAALLASLKKRKEFGLSDAAKKNISERMRGKKLSPSHVLGISNRMRGTKNPHYGKLGVDSPNFEFYVQAFRDGVLIGTYEGIQDCARKLELKATKICAVLNGRRNHTGNYTFKKNNGI